MSEYTRPGRYSGGRYALAVSGGASCNKTLPRGVNSKVWGVTTGPALEPPTTPPSVTDFKKINFSPFSHFHFNNFQAPNFKTKQSILFVSNNLMNQWYFFPIVFIAIFKFSRQLSHTKPTHPTKCRRCSIRGTFIINSSTNSRLSSSKLVRFWSHNFGPSISLQIIQSIYRANTKIKKKFSGNRSDSIDLRSIGSGKCILVI